jgi:hypothetical protein
LRSAIDLDGSIVDLFIPTHLGERAATMINIIIDPNMNDEVLRF